MMDLLAETIAITAARPALHAMQIDGADVRRCSLADRWPMEILLHPLQARHVRVRTIVARH